MLNTGAAFTLCVQRDWVYGKMQVLHFYNKISEWGLEETGILMLIPESSMPATGGGNAARSPWHFVRSRVRGPRPLWMALQAAA